MGNIEMTVFWGVLLVIFVIVEAVTIQMVSIWFALGALGAMIGAACGLAPVYQIVIFIIVAIVALVATRPFVKKITKGKIQRTNVDRNIGKEGVVSEDINNIEARGQVTVNGNEWAARSSSGESISKDAVVIIERIEGAKLIVSLKR